MNVAFAKPSWWQRLAPIFQGFDLPFVGIIVFMCALGLVNMYSVGFDHGTRFIEHGRNMLLGAMILFVVAQVPPQRLMALAVPLYTLGVVLLVATALFGITKKGATRWLNIGIVIQPSELLKIATPLMLAWWFQRREGQLRSLDYAAAGALLMLPVGLVLKQPDLGTSLLVLSGGLYVIFFAGLSWRLILPVLIAGVVGISLVVGYQDTLCEPEHDWVVLHGYQKQRVCTLLNPTADPLGKGFHIIQGMIAIGSGGITGKGFMQGTQTHLEFIPERTTDFAFAGYAEEHGLIGALVLMGGFLALIFRGLYIASQAPTLFSRLLAGSLSLSFFTYAFVNLGMVSGILPVVGVPLPFISYGGTAMVTLGLALGLLLSISRSRGLMQR
jgi:rod shape determining protein RodA